MTQNSIVKEKALVSRGPLRDYESSDGPSFQALIVTSPNQDDKCPMSVLGRTCVFLLSSIPTFLQRPYSVPLGIPNSVAAFCTAMPPLMASSAVLRSSWTRVTGGQG